MKAKVEAERLVYDFSKYCDGSIDESVFKAYDLKYGKKRKSFSEMSEFARLCHAKECALVSVRDTLDTLRSLHERSVLSEYGELHELAEYKFYNQVAEEIKNL